ncbi:MAG: amidophosphoribosyltransferase [Myxococcales bacterium]|nr:amidophosphoribosyltransferase [Myxococcales bacterium]
MCGVIGLYSTGRDVFVDTVNGLFQMQHRGQDACGVAISDGRRLRLHKALGYVREVFPKPPEEEFAGHAAIGHVRYPTQGGNRAVNAQPHVVTTLSGPRMALSSNGDLTNYWDVREELAAEGVDFVGTNDAELLLKYIAWRHIQLGEPILDAIRGMQRRIKGAYSSVLLTHDRLFAIRDPWGVRPLCWGHDDGTWVVASETNALDINHVDMTGDVRPGSVLEIGPGGAVEHEHPDVVAARGDRDDPSHCIFEYVYFSRPDSISFGTRVYDVRKRIGAWLAAHEDVEADVVVPVPDSSNAVALGYAHASGLPFEFGLIRNHYVGRTFISPTQKRRDDSVRRKFNPLRSVFNHKRVILVDDSIVRGTTLRKITRMVRGAGAREVHIRIGSPITRHSCFYGVDTPTADELIGSRLDTEGIRAHLTADSLRYMSVDGLLSCVEDQERFCLACFNGDYPIPITEAKQST